MGQDDRQLVPNHKVIEYKYCWFTDMPQRPARPSVDTPQGRQSGDCISSVSHPTLALSVRQKRPLYRTAPRLDITVDDIDD